MAETQNFEQSNSAAGARAGSMSLAFVKLKTVEVVGLNWNLKFVPFVRATTGFAARANANEEVSYMKILASALAMSLAMSATVAMAQDSTTTTTTTTVTTQAAVSGFSLPAGVAYYVVNPTTGVVVGDYTLGMSLAPGYYVIEKTSGKVMATVDPAGTLVAYTTAPAVVPAHFLVLNGQLVYFTDDFAFRRAQLEQKVTLEYAAGRLTNHQVKELREKLGYIANLETKRRGDLTYSKSTIRDIERRFAEVQSEMAKYVAETNTRKAKIGIVVN